MRKQEKKKDRVLRRLLHETRPIAGWLALGAGLDVLAVLAAVAIPELLGNVIQMLFDYGSGGRQGEICAAILPKLAILLGVYGASALFSYGNVVLMNRAVTQYFTCGLRVRISEKLGRLPVGYADRTPVGDIISRMSGDVGEMGGTLNQVFDVLVKGAFQVAIICVVMFREDWRLACFAVFITPLSIVLSTRVASRSEKYFDETYSQSGKLTAIVEESFTNFTTTKAYNLENYTQKKHAQVNDALRTATAKANFASSIVLPLISLANSLAYILINLLGGYLVVKQGVRVGVVVTIVLYARQLASPLEQLSVGFSQFYRVKAAARRVFAILDEPEEPDGSQPIPEPVKGNVQFSHVDFSYAPEQPLIQDLNLQVQPGQRIAIVGPTGAGKTTIVNLLMRFYDVNRGSICLDGQNIQTLTRQQLRSSFGMVLQETWLFRGTVAENVAYGRPDATRQEIEQACRDAYCHDFISAMPQGYDTVIGTDAQSLSGGQRQLLTIARAFLADRPLLILDEATSNVDTRTEALIQRAMDRLMRGRTCFVIAHRLSTIVDADRILVLSNGTIVEQGKHRQLLEKRGFYYQLYTSQYAIG